ncbi:MAG: ClpXP protease specificity-enhancing factor [Candidatus Parcubacteria bacterium]|nr:ClpXP protease specificity-enhancing factor [Burkholderiales bacterium]
MANAEISTKPYLLRALYEWCVDNGYTAHLAVKVDSRSQVPSEYVRNGEITLNVSPSAVHKLQMGNELIEFSARFAGVARQISVPVAGVYALYSRETGHGMTFEVDAANPALHSDAEKEPSNKTGPSNESGPAPLPVPVPVTMPTEPTKPTGGKPQLRRIK